MTGKPGFEFESGLIFGINFSKPFFDPDPNDLPTIISQQSHFRKKFPGPRRNKLLFICKWQQCCLQPYILYPAFPLIQSE